MRLETFQMIDRVVAFDAAARSLTAEATVPESSPVFEGHFPGYPIMPGVLLLETMAQASGYLILALNGMSRMPFFMAADKARFRTFVGPGARLSASARLAHDGSGFAATEASITVDGQRICDAEIRLRIVPFPAPEMEAALKLQAARIGLPPQPGA
jgi:3-hydroxyacyl-[acyl-carrier-protein] dehydratase